MLLPSFINLLLPAGVPTLLLLLRIISMITIQHGQSTPRTCCAPVPEIEHAWPATTHYYSGHGHGPVHALFIFVKLSS